MNLPGFTAEASLYTTSGYYHIAKGETQGDVEVRPQFRVRPFAGDGVDCEVLGICCFLFDNPYCCALLISLCF